MTHNQKAICYKAASNQRALHSWASNPAILRGAEWAPWKPVKLAQLLRLILSICCLEQVQSLSWMIFIFPRGCCFKAILNNGVWEERTFKGAFCFLNFALRRRGPLMRLGVGGGERRGWIAAFSFLCYVYCV